MARQPALIDLGQAFITGRQEARAAKQAPLRNRLLDLQGDALAQGIKDAPAKEARAVDQEARAKSQLDIQKSQEARSQQNAIQKELVTFSPLIHEAMITVRGVPLEQRAVAAEQVKQSLLQQGLSEALVNNLSTEDLSDATMDASIQGMSKVVKLRESDERKGGTTEVERLIATLPENKQQDATRRYVESRISGDKGKPTGFQRTLEQGNFTEEERDIAIRRELGLLPSIEAETKQKAEQTKLDAEKEKTKREGDIRKSRGRERAVTVSESIDKSLDLADRFFTEGLIGVVSSLPGVPFGSDAKELAGHLRTIKANTGLNELRNIKESSGAGLGSVTQGEHELLQSVVKSLEIAGDGEVLKENLLTYKVLYDAIVTESVAIPFTNEEFDNLENNSLFISPDTGKPMRKQGFTSVEVNPSDVILQMKRKEDRFKKESRMPDSTSESREFTSPGGVSYTVEGS